MLCVLLLVVDRGRLLIGAACRVRLSLDDTVVVHFGNRCQWGIVLAASVLLDTCQLFCAIVLHLYKLMKLAGVLLGLGLRLLDLLVCGRGEAVVVDVDAEELALTIRVNHQLDGGYLRLLTIDL